MTSTAAELFSVLSSSAAKDLTGHGAVWRLDGINRGTEALRESLLSTAARLPDLHVHYDGGRPDETSLQSSVAVAPSVWLVPAGASGKDLASWLYMGNWQLYSRPEPLKELIDLCRTDDASVSKFLQDSGLSFIIDSFHDDTSWTIGLQPEPQ
jgi:hypothetical protein